MLLYRIETVSNQGFCFSSSGIDFYGQFPCPYTDKFTHMRESEQDFLRNTRNWKCAFYSLEDLYEATISSDLDYAINSCGSHIKVYNVHRRHVVAGMAQAFFDYKRASVVKVMSIDKDRMKYASNLDWFSEIPSFPKRKQKYAVVPYHKEESATC